MTLFVSSKLWQRMSRWSNTPLTIARYERSATGRALTRQDGLILNQR